MAEVISLQVIHTMQKRDAYLGVLKNHEESEFVQVKTNNGN